MSLDLKVEKQSLLLEDHETPIIDDHHNKNSIANKGSQNYPREIAEIQRLFQILRTPPEQPNDEACARVSGIRMQGWLHVSGINTLRRVWKRRWCVLSMERSGSTGNWQPTINFQRSETSSHSARRSFNYLTVSVISGYDVSSQDTLYRQQFSRLVSSSTEVIADASHEHAESIAAQISRHRFHLWCTSQTIILSPDSDAEATAWTHAFETILEAYFSHEEIALKRTAASSLSPVLERQRQCEIRRYENLRRNFKDSGFGDIMPPKKFEGNLRWHREDAPPEGIKVHLVLFRRSITIGGPHRQEIPFGYIALRYMLDVRTLPGRPEFELSTPLTNFRFVAKHAASAEAWVTQIRSVMRRRLQTTGPAASATQELSGPVYFGKKKLVSGSLIKSSSSRGGSNWLFSSGSSKSYTLREGETIIGRSQNNTIRLTDTHVSRNHLKIINRPGLPTIVSDLGSQHGTFVNDAQIVATALRNNDQIRVGRISLRFVVKPHPKDQEIAISSTDPPIASPTQSSSSIRPVEIFDHTPLLRIEDSDDDDDGSW